jgi:simple sugar transport system permease protein
MVSELKQRETGGESMEPPVSRSLPSRLGAFLLRRPEATIAIAGLVLATYFALINNVFLTTANIRVVTNFAIPVAILAVGQTMLLISGEIDLSQGAVLFMTPFLVFFTSEAGLPLPLAILVAVLGAGVVGVINGVITIAARIPSFLVTVGMLLVVSGLTLNISDGFPKRAPSEGLAAAIFGGAPFSGIAWVVAIVIVMHIVLTKTRWGVYTVAIGGNQLGAREAGVPSTRIRMRNFVVCAMLAGFAGIIEGIRIGSFDPGAAVAGQKVFESVTAAVIGGTVLTGGYGTIIGAFLGAMVLAVLRDGFAIEGVSAFTFNMVLGSAIIVAMVLNSIAARARVRSQSARL